MIILQILISLMNRHVLYLKPSESRFRYMKINNKFPNCKYKFRYAEKFHIVGKFRIVAKPLFL